MKILGNATNGDLIIQVSEAEWGMLRDGRRPTSNQEEVEARYLGWNQTEALLFFKTASRGGERPFYKLFCEGKFGGTLKQMRKLLESKEKIQHLNKELRIHIIERLDGYEADLKA